MKTAILGATLIDGTGRAPMPDSAVLIDGERIADAGVRGAVAVPFECRQVDGRGKFLLPGMIELHSHAYFPTLVLGATGARVPEAYAATIMANNLRQALQAGITTVRDVLSMDYMDISIRRAIGEGVILGPRYFVAGRGIAMTGGHGSQAEGFVREADGPEDVRKAVREQAKAGVDHIKVLYQHAVLPGGYRQEEMDAAVDEAHRLGLRVACHVWRLDDARVAARAGVDTLEHGALMDDETLDLMAAKGLFWVPTCTVLYTIWEMCKKAMPPGTPPAQVAAEKRRLESYNARMPEMPRTFQGAARRGIKIGTGTDMIYRDYPYACVPEEVEWLTKLGYTPMQAIEAATRVSADALGRLADLGTVEKGKYADLIMVDRDPLADVTALKQVSWVMKGGRVVPFADEWVRTAGTTPWAPRPEPSE